MLATETATLGNWLHRPYFLALAGVICLYGTLSGHLFIVSKQHHTRQGGKEDYLSTIQYQPMMQIEKRTGHTFMPAVVANFTGYPLTREGMIAKGAAMGHSAVDRFQAKRQKATRVTATATDVQTTPFWCRPLPPFTPRRFLQPPLDEADRANNNQSSYDSTSIPPKPIEGLFFVKTPKTASQSINRILKRVTTRVGLRNRNGTTCHMRGHHIQGDPAAWYSHRHPFHSILLTSVRDPVSRALSRIYWTLSTRRAAVASSGMIAVELVEHALNQWTDAETGVTSNGQGGFQLNYISFPNIPPGSAWTPDQPTRVKNPAQIQKHVEWTLQEYDFILVQERLEESLVALQLLLGVDTEDILSMPLHVGGSYLYDRLGGCLRLLSPPKMMLLNSTDDGGEKEGDPVARFLYDHFKSATWQAQNYGDYLLWGAAQASLDQTIAALGRERFNTALRRFRQLQEAVLVTCSREVVFPCSANGTIQRDDYLPGSSRSKGDRYPQDDIEACVDRVVLMEQQQQQHQQ
jgi:Sulfotransferase family